MKKYLVLGLGLTLLTGALVLREIILLEEIRSTQSQLVSQTTDHIRNASTVARVRELSTSPIVFERYLSPIVSISERLLWPSHRMDILDAWKRSMHTHLEEASLARLQELSSSAAEEMKKIRAENPPSMNRLYAIVDTAEGRNADMSCSATVKEELKFIRDASQKRDQEILGQLKTEGTTQIKRLKNTLKGMNAKQRSEFFTSGRFHREFQDPVLMVVLQLKQEDLRRAAWDEFESKLRSVMNESKVKADSVAENATKANKNIAKLIESMSKTAALDEAKKDFPAPIPQPRMEVIPSEPTALVEPEERVVTPENPADGDQMYE